MHNYMLTGDLVGQRPRSPKCREHYTIASLLFEHLLKDRERVEPIFRRWTLARPREDSQSCAV
jgi:hypothetical protein